MRENATTQLYCKVLDASTIDSLAAGREIAKNSLYKPLRPGASANFGWNTSVGSTPPRGCGTVPIEAPNRDKAHRNSLKRFSYAHSISRYANCATAASRCAWREPRDPILHGNEHQINLSPRQGLSLSLACASATHGAESLEPSLRSRPHPRCAPLLPSCPHLRCPNVSAHWLQPFQDPSDQL